MKCLYSIFVSFVGHPGANACSLWGESTNVALLGACIVVRRVVVGRHHDIAVARSEGVSIGVVQVAGASSVTGAVVGELRNQAGG